MAQATLSVRMDPELKQDFDRVCDELGMSMTTAVTMLAKKMVREQRIPFDTAVDPAHQVLTRAELQRRIADLDAGKGVRVTFEQLEQLGTLMEEIRNNA